MGRSLKEGQFPVRWVSDLGYGYGYPIFNFYGPLPYYVGGALYAIGVPALSATKLMMGLGMLLPTVMLFVVLNSLLGWQIGLVSSLLYLYNPYHAVQVYVRGAVGEYWTLIFWPIILSGLIRRNIIIGAVGLFGAIISHTLMGYVTVMFVFFGVCMYWVYQRKITFQHLITILLGLGLSAFFWLPAVFEMGYTSVSGQVSETAHYTDHFICPIQLWSSLWGFGGSAPGCIDGMSFMLGKAHVLVALLSIFVWIFRRPKNAQHMFTLGLILAVTGIVLTLNVSQVVWKLLPGFSYLQYPWRFLSLATLGLSLLGGLFLVWIKNSTYQSGLAIIISIIILFVNMKWFTPQYANSAISESFEEAKDLRFRVSKISDEYLPPSFLRPDEESEVLFDTISGRKLEETATSARYVVESTESSEVVVHKAYFPGWRYWINNEEVVPSIEKGLPVLALGPGQSVVELTFTDTPVRVLGNMLSLISILIVGFYIYDNQRKTKR